MTEPALRPVGAKARLVPHDDVVECHLVGTKNLIDRYLDRNSLTLQIGGIAIVVLLILLFNRMYRRLVVLPANEP